MMMTKKTILYKKILFLLFFITSLPQFIYAQPELVFNNYVEALKAKEWKKAETYWLPQEIELSKRLGISYSGIDAKYDCASPIVNALEYIRNGNAQVIVTDKAFRENYAKISVQLVTPDESVTVPYYLVKSDDSWLMVSSFSVYTKDWKKYETRYVNVYCNDGTLVNEFALEKLNEFIELMGEHLLLSQSKMKLLEKEKINYYLCNEDEIEEITGFPTHGMTNLQFDAIVSRHLPHYHEVVHLLVNYALNPLPLFTLPCLQEGTAVCFGGRWGKSPQVIFQIGYFTLAQQFFKLEDILTYNGFHQIVGNPDFSYPISGIFVRFLIEKFGIEKLKLLYRRLSGNDKAVQNFSLDYVQSKIAEVCGMTWTELDKSFAEYWKKFEFSGLIPDSNLPSQNKSIEKIKSKHLSAKIWDCDDAYLFEIESDNNRPNGVILIKKNLSSDIKDYKSELFTDHLPNAKYDGELYGIAFTSEEAGLYNYYTEDLIAKYIFSFSPNEDYWNSEEKVIRFRLAKSVFDCKISECRLKLAEP